MPAPHSFEYALIRVVPYVERGEYINAGAILYCRALGVLEARIELDHQRLHALAPACDSDEIACHLALIPRICAGGMAAGTLGTLSQGERFHWLVAPRSTVIQTSPAHAGRCDDPASALENLLARAVRLPVPLPGGAPAGDSPTVMAERAVSSHETEGYQLATRGADVGKR
ncbi:MAG: DUF3037 domain-containing protein [Ktedonobacterales bacterium]|nr:DUF3037 domain-containing protein [Ktedonobacterales bacterium]